MGTPIEDRTDDQFTDPSAYCDGLLVRVLNWHAGLNPDRPGVKVTLRLVVSPAVLEQVRERYTLEQSGMLAVESTEGGR